MSDIQDLIHKSTMRAVAIGATYERDRIVELLKAKQLEVASGVFDAKGVLADLISVIKEDAVVSEEA